MNKFREYVADEFSKLRNSEEAQEMKIFDSFKSGYDHYKSCYEETREILLYLLLYNRLSLSDIPQKLRIKDVLFFIHAHRYGRDYPKPELALETLKMFRDDFTEGVKQGLLEERDYQDCLRLWLNELSYDIIAFKGDKNFERYFQEQKEANRTLFESFDL